MRNVILALVALVFSGSVALADGIRIGKLSNYHATVGTATALAIPAVDVGGNVQSWKICNDAINTSTYLLVGQAVDVSTDGTAILPNTCFVCENCTSALLKLMKVEGQAAANGYSVIQYRQ